MGYVWKSDDGRLFMQRCPKCESENWVPAVATGCCVWCGYVALESDIAAHGRSLGEILAEGLKEELSALEKKKRKQP